MARLLTFACALLLAVSAAAWTRSYIARDLISWSNSAGRYVEVTTVPGLLRLTLAQGWPRDQPLHWYGRQLPPWLPVFGQQAMDSGGITTTRAQRAIWLPAGGPTGAIIFVTPYRIVQIPFASLTALALLPLIVQLALTLRRHRRRRARLLRGLCPDCGYDMRATPTRCPECGPAATV